MLQQAVHGKHASENTKLHCLYAYYLLGYSKLQLSKLYAKHYSTIEYWIHKYETEGSVQRRVHEPYYKNFSV
jgi:transposase